jgi:hypothetical protein
VAVDQLYAKMVFNQCVQYMLGTTPSCKHGAVQVGIVDCYLQVKLVAVDQQYTAMVLFQCVQYMLGTTPSCKQGAAKEGLLVNVYMLGQCTQRWC